MNAEPTIEPTVEMTNETSIEVSNNDKKESGEPVPIEESVYNPINDDSDIKVFVDSNALTDITADKFKTEFSPRNPPCF